MKTKNTTPSGQLQNQISKSWKEAQSIPLTYLKTTETPRILLSIYKSIITGENGFTSELVSRGKPVYLSHGEHVIEQYLVVDGCKYIIMLFRRT